MKKLRYMVVFKLVIWMSFVLDVKIVLYNYVNGFCVFVVVVGFLLDIICDE